MKRRYFSLVEFFVATSLFIVAFSLTLGAFLFYQKSTKQLSEKVAIKQELFKAKNILQSTLLGASERSGIPMDVTGKELCFFLPGNIDKSMEMMQDHYVKLKVEKANLVLIFQNVKEQTKMHTLILLKNISGLEFGACSLDSGGQWEEKKQILLAKPKGLIRIKGYYRNQNFEWICSLPDHIEITKEKI